jgi:2-polyprenyl-6-methoxyphenol hydroxylase-like FAD-dependent oxidoreductase
MNSNRRILISGAGIAGLTLAYWLNEFGFEPMVVEKRPDLSDEGYMIDFYGAGYDVAEKMGLLDALRARHYRVQDLQFVNESGKPQATMDLEKFRAALGYRHYNFMRGDLADVLCNALQGRAPVRFDAGVTHVEAGAGAVTVELADGTTETCDLLIGADGFHSAVRKQLWGPESPYDRFLGYYVACDILAERPEGFDTFYSLMVPKKQASIYPIRGDRLASFFAFKSERRETHTRPAQLALLKEVYGDLGWVVPQLLAGMDESRHFYFDEVSQIRLDSWHQGRVALVGDACYCLTLLAGQGASMAMAGAYILADELRQAEGDYQAAFKAYQARLEPEIDERQKNAQGLAASFVPDNEFALWIMHQYLKVAFWPGLRELFIRQVGARSFFH